jgi:hypothetical protein
MSSDDGGHSDDGGYSDVSPRSPLLDEIEEVMEEVMDEVVEPLGFPSDDMKAQLLPCMTRMNMVRRTHPPHQRTVWTPNYICGMVCPYKVTMQRMHEVVVNNYCLTTVDAEDGSSDVMIKMGTKVYNIVVSNVSFLSEFFKSKRSFDTRRKESEIDCIEVPESVCSDIHAMNVFMCYMHTSYLTQDISNMNPSEIMKMSDDFASETVKKLDIGEVDLWDVYKLAQYFEVTSLVDLLLRECIDMFGQRTSHLKLVRQIAYILDCSQYHDMVATTDLYNAVIAFIGKYPMAANALLCQPLSFAEKTWLDVIKTVEGDIMYLGNIVEVFQVLFQSKGIALYGDGILSSSFKEHEICKISCLDTSPSDTEIKMLPIYPMIFDKEVKEIVRVANDAGFRCELRPVVHKVKWLWLMIQRYVCYCSREKNPKKQVPLWVKNMMQVLLNKAYRESSIEAFGPSIGQVTAKALDDSIDDNADRHFLYSQGIDAVSRRLHSLQDRTVRFLTIQVISFFAFPSL